MQPKASASELTDYATIALVEANRQTEITQRAESIEFAVSTETKRAKGVENDIKLFTEQARTYFSFDEDGMRIREEGSRFSTLTGNEKLSFEQDGVEVAYIQYNRLYISIAEIKKMLTIGNPEVGYTDIDTQNGGLSFVWRAN